MTRAEWKIFYRALRVARRESGKAAIDMLFFGTGCVVIPEDGSDPYHVPIQNVVFKRMP